MSSSVGIRTRAFMLALVGVLGVLALFSGVALATTPGASPSNARAFANQIAPSECGGITTSGRTIAYRGVLVDLPVGHVYNWVGADLPSGPALRICIVEYASTITIDALTAFELERVVGDLNAAAILDQIAASARINPQPTPGPGQPPPSVPQPTSGPPPARDLVSDTCSGGSSGGPYAYGAIVVDPPVGYIYSYRGESDSVRGWTALNVCVLEYASAISLDATNGRELRRQSSTPAGDAILNEIARRVKVNANPTPYPFEYQATMRARNTQTARPGDLPQLTPPAPIIRVGDPSRTGPITPPSTGDGGLCAP